jgi:hypothetical protein
MRVSSKTFFESYILGDLKLQNRIVMSSMSRERCDPNDGIPNDLLLKYYTQRNSAGLILCEAVPISMIGNATLDQLASTLRNMLQDEKKLLMVFILEVLSSFLNYGMGEELQILKKPENHGLQVLPQLQIIKMAKLLSSLSPKK